MSVKQVAIFTGNRAEFGLQYPIIKAIEAHPELDYQLLVSGAHLDSNWGNTLQEIRDDGFDIAAEINIQLDDSLPYSTPFAIGSGIHAMCEALDRLKPDILVVYADRFEGFAAVIAATQMNIPVAHIEGGDLTEGGALDDSVRHAMSKLSHLHFTTNQQASNRLLCMGEESWRIHTVGLPAIDVILENNYAPKEEVVERLGLDTERPIVIFTQHSVTTQANHSKEQITPSIEAIKELAEMGTQCILTYPNNDAGSRDIVTALNTLKERNLENILVYPSLGRRLYHGVLALAKSPEINVTCVGNSSSGIKETPIFGCPTVNIGTRQQGRLCGDNVLHTSYYKDDIVEAVLRCQQDLTLRKRCADTSNPYFFGLAGKAVANVIANTEIDDVLLQKKMTLSGEIANVDMLLTKES